jgi:hypothetical protein
MRKDYDSKGFPEVQLSYADVLTRPLFYPENDFARDMAHLMRRKCFTKKEVEYMRSMGINVSISARKIEIPKNFM